MHLLNLFSSPCKEFYRRCITSLMLLLLFTYSETAIAQQSCFTTSNPCGVDALPPSVQASGDPYGNAPIYLKVYANVIRRPDGSGGQPNDVIDEAFQRLSLFFTPHNIFFIRACENIDVITPDIFHYENTWFASNCFANPALRHLDGIDVFFGPDDLSGPPNGQASCTAMSLAGVWNNATLVNGQLQPLSVSRSSTVAHEMGHVLGLRHTSGNDANSYCCELVNRSNGFTCGDFVEDTNADPRFWRNDDLPNPCNYVYSPANGLGVACLQSLNPPYRDTNGHDYDPPVSNIMAVQQLVQQCIDGFTIGQGKRMRKVISISPALQACLLHPPGTIGNSFISTTTWNTPRTMLDDVTVPSGQELIIEAEVKMREGKKVVVERNARLIVRNAGKLTSMCDVWNGVNVLGNRYIEQPAHTAALNNPYQAGIVIVENGGTIENALTGISTGAFQNHRNWGGVIYTNGAAFTGNRRDVEFMSYPGFLNKSRFNNTIFKSGKNNQPGYGMGVTIWETNDIRFTGCTFNGKTGDGILTHDAMIMVNGASNFSENGKGIAAYATYPMASSTIIKDLSDPNVFTKNIIGIDASSSTGFFPATYTDGRFALEIVNNNFIDNGTAGIVIDGSSNYTVGGNDFTKNHPAGVWVTNTAYNNAFQESFIWCNDYTDFDLGIYTLGDNRGMQFLDNAFSNAVVSDFYLAAYWGVDGMIRPVQGDPDQNRAALNCFSKPFSVDDIYTDPSSATAHFDYYFNKTQAACSPEPVTLGNYEKFDLNDPIASDCSAYGGLLPPICTFEELEAKRAQLNALLPSIEFDPAAKSAYYSILPQKEAVLKHLVGEALLSDNYQFVEQLLEGEGTKAAQTAIYGLRIKRGDYEGAASKLSQLPIENDEDITFRDIQLINLQRLQNLDSFELSQPQEAFLNAVADGHSPIRGYARGILSLLKGNRYYPEPIELTFERAMHPPRADVSALTAFPNPASNQVTITYPVLGFDSEIKVFDSFGNLKFQRPLSAKTSAISIPTIEFVTGLYQALLNDSLGYTHQVRFVVQH